MTAVKGRIHSIETGGMVDGPGLRFVVFLQGCPLRCLYCHNPDTWKRGGGREVSSEEIVSEAWKYRTWMDASGGGITLSGGDPLFQPEFTLDIIRRAHKKKMAVALDTAGHASLEAVRECLDEADLILLDIKAASAGLNKRVTGQLPDRNREILDYLKKINKDMWIRHVVVPGLTDGEEDLNALLSLLKEIPSLKRFELLPFHKMGEEKWGQEGLPYRLGDTPIPSREFMEITRRRFIEAGIPMTE